VVTGGFFVTCWHCVKEPLEPNVSYAAIYPAPNSPPGGAGLIPLDDLAQGANGEDLAIARVTAPATPRLVLAERPGAMSEEVYTIGFPLLPPPEQQVSGNLIFADINPRFLRGYVTKAGVVELANGRRVDSLEVDMLVPPGLSGAPLLRRGSLEVIGVLFGNHGSYSIDTMSSVNPLTGAVTPEVRSQVNFGLAHQTKRLWNVRGPALDHRTLRQFSA